MNMTEYGPDGTTLMSTLVDHGDGTGTLTHYTDGVATSTETVECEIEAPYPPLDPTGALATLLVVEGVLPLVDAANAIHEEPEHLVHEAEAWSVAP